MPWPQPAISARRMTSAIAWSVVRPSRNFELTVTPVMASASPTTGCEASSTLCSDHAPDRQPVFGRELEIALVVAGRPEQRAGAVVHQHEVRDVHRHPRVLVERMDRLDRRAIAGLLRRLDLGDARAAALTFGDELGRLWIALGYRLCDRMPRRNRDEARPEDRVRPRREHFDFVDSVDCLGEAESELQAAALADPILLHQANLVRPLIEGRQPLEQLVGELRDLEEPLRELAPFDRRAGAPALAVDHLLVGENGHVDRVPIDLAFLAVDEAGVEQVEEQRLFVAVIIGIAGRELAAPVEREAKLLQLLAHCRDIGPGPFAGMDLALHRGIFRRHSEGVPAHRVEHFHSLHPPVAREHVAHGVIAHVAHVDAPRWIGEHLEDIGLGLAAAAVGDEGPLLVPARLPAPIGRARVETPGHGMSVSSRGLTRGAGRGLWSG